MDPHRRRRTSASTVALTGLLAVALGAAALLLRQRPSEVAARTARGPVASDRAPGRVPDRAPDRSVLAAPDRRVAIDSRLSARLQGRIAEFQERAGRETKGRVTARSVDVALHVREIGAEGEIVSIGADRPMRPASNLKLVTSSAALVLLGVDWSFETVFETDAPIDIDGSGLLRGDLAVRAGADPFYDRGGDGSIDALIAPAVAALKERGIRAIEGAIVLDELDYTLPEPGPGWPDPGQRWSEFCALAGGFSANAGCLTASVQPREIGEAAAVSIEPRHCGLERKGRVETAPKKNRLDIRVEARAGAAHVFGSIPQGVPAWRTRFAAPDPVDLFGHALAGALADGGIAVRGGWRRAHAPTFGRSKEIARISTPITAVLPAIDTDSNNACADQLFLALGHARGGAGTREGGRAAVARALERLGVPSEGLVQVDGSGLSRENRITARQITGLIQAVLAQDERTASAFVDSLAVASESGTLDERMSDPLLAGRVRAKTGFIAGTSALSGILETKDGRRLAFSILVEYPPTDGLNRTCWKPMEDAICSDLAGADG